MAKERFAIEKDFYNNQMVAVEEFYSEEEFEIRQMEADLYVKELSEVLSFG